MNTEEFTLKIKGYLDFLDDFLDTQKNFPIKTEGLICLIQKEFELKDTDKRKVDTIVRMYLKSHDKYDLSPGIQGGVKPKKKSKLDNVPEEVRAAVRAEVEAEITKGVNKRMKELAEANARVTSSLIPDEKD
jgi:hypothetical protein